MGIASLVTYRVKPGRMDDFLANIGEAKQVVEGLAENLQSIRAFRAAVAGPDTGRVHIEFTYGDMSDWGETYMREESDPDFNAMVARGMGPDSPAELVGRGIQTEITPSAGTETGAAMLAAIGRVKPGRMQEYLGHIEDLNQLALAHGAGRVRHLMMSVAGPFTGHVVALSEYPDMAALGAAWISRNNDPAWGRAVDSVLGADGPVTLEGQAILLEIPL